MADLSSDLQASINELGTQHNNLIQAVRDYKGGSIAGATNELLASKDSVVGRIKNVERSMLGLVDRDSDVDMPSLIVDFVNGIYMRGTRRVEEVTTLDELSHSSFSAGGGNKYEWGPNGRLKKYLPDELPYAYDPATGELLGLAIRNDSANLLDDWGDFRSGSSWSHTSGVQMTISNEPNPVDGGNCSLLTQQADGGTVYFSDNLSVSDKSKYTHSIMFKPYGNYNESLVMRLLGHSNQFGGGINVNYRVATGELACSALPDDQFGIEELSNGWKRLWFVAETLEDVKSSSFAFLVWPYGIQEDVGFYLYGAQLVKGDDSGLIIPPYEPRGGTELRLALGAEWFNPLQYTAVLKYLRQGKLNVQFPLALYYSGSEYVGIDYSNVSAGYVKPAGVFYRPSDPETQVEVVDRIIAVSSKIGYGAAMSVNGVYSYLPYEAGGPEPDPYSYSMLTLGGRHTTFQSPGVYAKLEVYPKYFSSPELGELTAR